MRDEAERSFFDSHCHLDHPSLAPRLPELLREAEMAGITGFLIPGLHPDGWDGIFDIASDFPGVLPSVGVHPMHAELLTPEAESKLRLSAASAAAIGEIGLDYAIPHPSRELQQHAFRIQLRAASDSGIPVLIHCRNAFADLLAILKEERVENFGGVMHAFSGSPEIARQCLKLGLYLSLAGTVTYLNAVRPPAVAALVPLERLLLETDAPDLAPEPYRGAVNVPAYLLKTAEKVASVKNVPVDELARATSRNARRLFRLPS